MGNSAEAHSVTTELLDGGAIALIRFAPDHRLNPFSSSRMRELAASVREAAAKPEARVVVLHGGAGRAFSAGGDFRETSAFAGGPEVDAWLDAVENVYTELLACPLPVVAAAAGHAIGFGLQLALCCDLRVGGPSTDCRMPELALGMPCIVGTFLLQARASAN